MLLFIEIYTLDVCRIRGSIKKKKKNRDQSTTRRRGHVAICRDRFSTFKLLLPPREDRMHLVFFFFHF